MKATTTTTTKTSEPKFSLNYLSKLQAKEDMLKAQQTAIKQAMKTVKATTTKNEPQTPIKATTTKQKVDESNHLGISIGDICTFLNDEAEIVTGEVFRLRIVSSSGKSRLRMFLYDAKGMVTNNVRSTYTYKLTKIGVAKKPTPAPTPTAKVKVVATPTPIATPTTPTPTAYIKAKVKAKA